MFFERCVCAKKTLLDRQSSTTSEDSGFNEELNNIKSPRTPTVRNVSVSQLQTPTGTRKSAKNIEQCSATKSVITLMRSHKKAKRFSRMKELKKKLKDMHGSLKIASKASGVNYRTLVSLTREPQWNGCRWVKPEDVERVRRAYQRQDFSMTTPNRRDAGKYFLKLTRKEAYEKYTQLTEDEGGRVLSASAVNRALPRKEFKPMCDMKDDTCKCPVCTNYNFLLRGMQKAFDGVPDKFTENVANALCDPDVTDGKTHIFHFKRACIFGECKKCTQGMRKLNGHLVRSNKDYDRRMFEAAEWEEWRSSGQRQCVNVEMKGTRYDLVQAFTKATKEMAVHLWHMKWQEEQYERCKAGLHDGDALFVMDFAQNMELRLNHEVQSAHWSHRGATVHPVIMMFFVVGKDGKRYRVTHELIFISSDKTHDVHLVENFLEIAVRHLRQDLNYDLKRLFVWTDNCAAQYKCYHAFERLSTRQYICLHNYFCPSHGKGPADSAVGRLSKLLDSHINCDRCRVRTPEALFQYCKTHFTEGPFPDERLARSFHYVEEANRDFEITTQTLPGTMKIHCIRNTGTRAYLDYRANSCMCPGCMAPHGSGVKAPCSSSSKVLPFKTANITKLVETDDTDANRYKSRKKIVSLGLDKEQCKYNDADKN